MINCMHAAGRLTRDPEVRSFSNGQKVAKIGLALNRKYKNKEGVLVDDVCYLDCEGWNGFVDTIAKYLRKGSMVYLQGRLKLDTWTDKTSGQDRQKIKLVIEDLKLFPKTDGGVSKLADERSSEEGKIIPLSELTNVEEPVHESNAEVTEADIPF